MKKLLLFVLVLLPMVASAKVKRTIHVATAGTLSTLISEEEKYEIEELTLTGEINGNDLRLIRNMAGTGDYYQDDGEHESTSGKLAYLDLSEVIIKAGGRYYTWYLGDEKVAYGFCLEIDNEIPTYVFNNCKNLISIIIPNSVISIGIMAFSGTTWFKNQPDGVVYAGKVAYCYKGEMPVSTSIILKDDTKGIAEDAFVSRSISSITIPNSVESIGREAFWGCSGLNSITIPNSVEHIGSKAFFGCSSLTTVTSEIENPFEIGNSVFDSYDKDIYSTATLIVPKGTKAAYQATAGWKLFTNIVESDEQEEQKCSKPTISLVDGKAVFNCETPGVTYHWSISSPMGNSGQTNSLYNYIDLPITLNVYATKDGYQNSDVATYEFSGLVGDVDGNGVVNVADHVELTKIIMTP